MDLSHAYTAPACNTLALGFLGLEENLFLLVTKTSKIFKLVTRLALVFFAGHWKPSICTESPHF